MTLPTCDEEGYTNYTCTVCGDSYVADYIELLGHDWHGSSCRRCDAKCPNPFVDVPMDAFFLEPVLWAAQRGITTGTGENTFSPYKNVTRGEVVTFLWRAMGEPEAQGEATFADVVPDSDYATAVAWAVENGITFGMGDGYFGVNSICIRAQVVTFLYRTFA